VEEPVRGFAPLGAVVVNVGGLETRRYARVGVELGVASPKDAKHVEEFKASLLDLLISEVAATPVERLASSEGRARLKQDLLARIQGELGLREVRRVYFTEFMIQ
jgi:flagellar basal body-associated protein FliL